MEGAPTEQLIAVRAVPVNAVYITKSIGRQRVQIVDGLDVLWIGQACGTKIAVDWSVRMFVAHSRSLKTSFFSEPALSLALAGHFL
jgi:hypothetical protein